MRFIHGLSALGRLKLKLVAFYGAVIVSMLLASAVAQATLIYEGFKFYNSSDQVVAYGSFDYDSSLSGSLTYADLSSFSITINGHTYDLSFVDTANQYVYFDYNTVSNSFVPADVNGYQGSFGELIGAIVGTGSSGFFWDPLPGMSIDNNDGIGCTYPPCNSPSDYIYAVSESIPEPSSIALLGTALVIGGAMFRRRNRRSRGAS